MAVGTEFHERFVDSVISARRLQIVQVVFIALVGRVLDERLVEGCAVGGIHIRGRVGARLTHGVKLSDDFNAPRRKRRCYGCRRWRAS